jgi:predicted enzyme related to lactoylglutathione lyase
MSIRNALASVPVKNLESSVAWYERLFGRPPDSRPMGEVAEWKFAGGGWLQVYELPERAGGGSVTLSVSRIEEQIARLDDLAIDTTRKTSGPKVKTVMITDPDGNSIALAEALDPGMAH